MNDEQKSQYEIGRLNTSLPGDKLKIRLGRVTARLDRMENTTKDLGRAIDDLQKEIKALKKPSKPPEPPKPPKIKPKDVKKPADVKKEAVDEQ